MTERTEQFVEFTKQADSEAEQNGAEPSPAMERVVTNAVVKFGDGDSKPEKFPMRMNAIIARTRQQTGGWPRRIGTALFVDDKTHGISFLDKPPALFGWLARKVGRVSWHGGAAAVKQPELFAEYQRTATSYLSVEPLPHEPPMPNRYYSHADITAGDGSRLREMVQRFCPATDIDIDLILSAFLTPGWGGPAGCRPCFVITSDDGRGAGKSTVAEMVGRLWQGILSFSAAEDINKIKTRLLSNDALLRRVCLLDNVKSLKFSWAELEAMITAGEIGGHRMFHGEATRPNTLTWFITLNGASLSTDMAQRAVVVKVKKPPRSATWLEDTQQFIDQHREQLIADVVGILRRPVEPLAKFSRWASWEREILGRLPEPNEAQTVIAERQDAVDVETDEVAVIEDYFADRLKWLGYDPITDRVFIPSNVATSWYCTATNERKGAVAVGRILSQLCTEGRCKRLSRTGRTHGRGFIWAQSDESALSSTWTDITERIADHDR